jgi:hypothetical protein
MARKLLNLLAFGLIFWVGCKSSEQPFFDLGAGGASAAPTSNLVFLLQDTALPDSTSSTLVLEEADVPQGSLYLAVSQTAADSSFFQLEVKAKGMRGVYDTPLTISYDPSLLDPQGTGDVVQIQEGPESSRLRKEFEPIPGFPRLVSLLAAKHPADPSKIVLSQSLLVDLGTGQEYSGTLFSLNMRVLASTAFRTVIGIDLGTSEALDHNGTSIPTEYFGGILTREI